MSAHRCRQGRLQVVTTGALFVIAGIVVWVAARGGYSVRDVWVFWPVVFVLPALQRLTAPPPQRSLFAGAAWLALGAALVGANSGHLRVVNTLAVLLVVAGSRLLYLSWTRRRLS